MRRGCAERADAIGLITEPPRACRPIFAAREPRRTPPFTAIIDNGSRSTFDPLTLHLTNAMQQVARAAHCVRLAARSGQLAETSTSAEITWLLAAVSQEDQSALARLYEATCAKLYGVVVRIVRRHDLAADVMEEAYLQIWRDAAEFNPAHSSPL